MALVQGVGFGRGQEVLVRGGGGFGSGYRVTGLGPWWVGVVCFGRGGGVGGLGLN